MRPGGGAALLLAGALVVGCGGDAAPGDEDARRVAVEALTAMRDGDARRVCSLLDARERRAAKDAAGSCEAAYREAGQTGGTAPPSALQPGPVVGTKADGKARVVTVRPRATGRDVRVWVTEEDERLVVAFDRR